MSVDCRGPFNLRTLNSFESASEPPLAELKLESTCIGALEAFGGLRPPRVQEECLQSWILGLTD